MDVSESAEMYVLKAALLEEGGTEAPVPVPQLADELGISQVSVNQMCRKLQEQGLLLYQPYKGVTLTDVGQRLANQVIRRRRLWEVFLHDRLGMSVAGAEEVACRLEHVTTCEVADRLDAFLDHPRSCPHDKSIPRMEDRQAAVAARGGMTLAELGAGDTCRVVRLPADEATKSFLVAQGITAGVELTVDAVGEDRTVLVASNHGMVSLAQPVSQALQVQLVDVDARLGSATAPSGAHGEKLAHHSETPR